MDAVGHRQDWDVVLGQFGPHRPPHRARNLSVHLADAVAPPGEPQRQRRHIEMRPSIAVRMAAERQELFAVEAQRLPVTVEMLFDQMEGEYVVPGGNRRMRREYACRADKISGFVETHPALDQ